MNILQTPSPNFGKSKYPKIGVQIHKTLGLMPWTLKWLRNPRAFASAHFLIVKDGTIYQLVQIKDRAWSAGRIWRPSKRAKKIMLKNKLGLYVKPGKYLIEIEYECLLNEIYTEAQYKSSVWLFNQFPFDITEDNFLTHQDTCSYKPNLERERREILTRISKPDECDSRRLVLDNWRQLRIKIDNGKIILAKEV